VPSAGVEPESSGPHEAKLSAEPSAAKKSSAAAKSAYLYLVTIFAFMKTHYS
jgi:hypothetical protein